MASRCGHTTPPIINDQQSQRTSSDTGHDAPNDLPPTFVRNVAEGAGFEPAIWYENHSHRPLGQPSKNPRGPSRMTGFSLMKIFTKSIIRSPRSGNTCTW